MRWALVFASAFAASAMWARWHLTTTARNAVQSSLWDMGILALGAVTVDAYIHSRWYVVPVVTGGGLGNYMAVRRG